MTIVARFRAELQASQGVSHRQLSLADGPRRLRCDLDQCDALAATVYRLVLESSELAHVDAPTLQRLSGELAGRVNYLLEPLAPIETDALGCVVQMRSAPPQADDDGCRYYELLVSRGGSLEICRYEQVPGQARRRIPAVLTHEVAVRLADDFARSLDSLARSAAP